MKLGIMQPYFFPYIGYYDLINRTDRWVVFDVVQYTPKSWMNRNRVLHPRDGWQYITVPVHKHVGEQTIADVRIVDKDSAQSRILGQIEHYRHGRAPHFRAVRNLVERAFAETQTNLLRDLNVASLRVVCEYLEMPFSYQIQSQSDIQLPQIHHPGQWALEISSALGAHEYINPPGGRAIFRPTEFLDRGIRLSFTGLADLRYECGPYEFVEGLSIVDVLMWMPPEAVKSYLESRRYETDAA